MAETLAVRLTPRGGRDAVEGWACDPEGRPYLKVRVYNIEVEDFHTYYVGGNGVWVHNTNCTEPVKLMNGTGKLPDPSIGRCASDKSLSEATAADEV